LSILPAAGGANQYQTMEQTHIHRSILASWGGTDFQSTEIFGNSIRLGFLAKFFRLCFLHSRNVLCFRPHQHYILCEYRCNR